MRVVERYVASYIMDCLFPDDSPNAHMDYIYQVLRETGTRSERPIIQQVLDYTRQTDPASFETRAMVADFVRSAILNRAETPRKPQFVARYMEMEDLIVYMVRDSEQRPIAFSVSTIQDSHRARKALEEQFPGIVYESAT